MTIKKKLIAGLMTAAIMCTSAVPFAVALEDGRSNLPKSFTEGSAISACINSDIVVVLKADHTLWASGQDIDNIYPAFTQIASDVKSCFYDGGRIGIIKIDDSFWTADLSTFKSEADFVKQMTDVKFAIVNERNILVLKKDNTVWGWGTDLTNKIFPINVKELPSNTISYNGWNTEVTTPVKMMDDVQEMASSFETTLFLKTDGSLYGVGVNSHGQLCQKTPVSDYGISTPVKLMDGVKHIAAAGRGSYVIKSDNTLWGWGILPWLNETSYANTPVKLADNVKSAQETRKTLAYVTTDGALWGYGDLLPGCENNPVDKAKKSSLSNVESIYGSIYSSHGIAVTTNGAMYAWGATDMISGGDSSTNFYDVYNHSQYGVNLTDFLQIAGPTQTTNGTSTEKPTTKPTATATATASPSSAKVQINGKQVTFDAYSINDNNYFKLRDIAKVLSGTKKQFEVTWNGATKSIELKPNTAYTAVGGELATGKAVKQTAKLSADTVYMNGNVASLTAYTINGNNYFKLRDLGKLLDFGVGWDNNTRTISINTNTSYTE